MAAQQSDGERPVFVLVHGAWHGGWCYARTARILRARGYEVYTPTLTGVSDRAHLVSPEIGLSTHVADVAGLLRWEDLRNVVLAGHSYGGVVISGVYEQARDRIGALSFIDAIVPASGQAMLDTVPPEVGRSFLDGAAERGFGWLVPPTPAEFFNVNPADRAWVDRLCTPQPLRTFQEPVAFGPREAGLRQQYLLATGFENPVLPAMAAPLRADPAWSVEDVPVGHDIMIDAPERLADLLERLAAAA